MRSFDTFIESKLHSITITEAGNSLEQSVLESYDLCVEQKYYASISLC